jgi:plasmid stabilization system protein ParE
LTLPLRIGDEAGAEAEEATRWYELQRAGLGLEFLKAVDAALARIEENPKIGARLFGFEDVNIRHVFVRRFPYKVVYLELADRIEVLAVAHDRRRPAYWLERLPP